MAPHNSQQATFKSRSLQGAKNSLAGKGGCTKRGSGPEQTHLGASVPPSPSSHLCETVSAQVWASSPQPCLLGAAQTCAAGTSAPARTPCLDVVAFSLAPSPLTTLPRRLRARFIPCRPWSWDGRGEQRPLCGSGSRSSRSQRSAAAPATHTAPAAASPTATQRARRGGTSGAGVPLRPGSQSRQQTYREEAGHVSGGRKCPRSALAPAAAAPGGSGAGRFGVKWRQALASL